MRADRNIDILTAGLRAGHEKLFRPESMRRSEYPHDFDLLYSYLEDEMNEVFSAIAQNNSGKIFDTIGAVIARASMIAELADTTRGTEDFNAEISNN